MNATERKQAERDLKAKQDKETDDVSANGTPKERADLQIEHGRQVAALAARD